VEKIPEKLLELKNDLVFQKLFGKPKNSKITSHFLSLILEKEINNIDLDVNKRMLRSREKSKTGRLDIRAKFNDGEDCDIELQVLPYENMPERMLEYWSGMYDNKINSGQKYNVLKPSICILITDYKLKQTQNISKYHTIWNLREKDYPDTIITDNIEMHILEMPKVNDDEILTDELVQWLKFIENPADKEVQKFMSENKYLKQAKEELSYLSDDPDFQLLVDSRAGMLRDIECMKDTARKYGFEEGKADGFAVGLTEGKAEGLAEGKAEGLAEGRAEGKAEGRAEGRAEGKAEGKAEGRAEGRAEGEVSGAQKKQLEIAKKMKAKNMPLEDIIELTGLTKEEIEKL
jgi:predicted transposase/invertase (TIGR01784 family)